MNELINSLKKKQDCVLDEIKGKENDDVLVKLKEFNEKKIKRKENENEPKSKKEKF